MRRRPRLARALLLVIIVTVLGLSLWYANSPVALPTASATVKASTPTGQPVYVGVFAPAGDFTRTLSLSGVKVNTTSNTEVSVVPLLCRDGSVGVTTEPDQFCRELINPEGQTFRSGDAIVLKVSGEDPAVAVIDRIRLGFREGVQWGTHEAGSPVLIRVLGR